MPVMHTPNVKTKAATLKNRFFGALILTASTASSSAVVNYTVSQSARRNSGSDESVGSSTAGRGTAFVAPRSKGTSLAAKRSEPMKRASAVAFGSAATRAFGVDSSVKMAATASCEASAGEKERKKPLTSPPLYNFRNSFSHSWVNQLSAEDPHNLERSLKRSSGPGRPVFNGHYVPVRPKPLQNPKMVITSDELMEELGFHPDEGKSEAFLKYFSGDVDGAFEGMEEAGEKGTQAKEIETWATPYALSIMGRRYTNNCPYGDGTGYGDGRAISIAEIIVPHDSDSIDRDGIDNEKLYPHVASRYELQLKGAGQTPFCRGADGRAVLRSSIREFLASEAMHHLGISTTRALSLIVSDSGDTSTRPWYSDAAQARELPSMDDPRLSQYNDEQKREILRQLAAQMKSDPDTLQQEKNAITTRVARSFSRIGHLDLFARRVEMLAMSEEDHPVKETRQYQELEDMMWHVCYREWYSEAYEPYIDKRDAKSAAMVLMEKSLTGISEMVAGWIRVGFVQGNFNADNCLVAGRTMDYGPFGFVDVYHPLSAKWTGSGEHFGFMNQPNAGFANFAVLVESLLPIIDANGGDGEQTREDMLEQAKGVFSDAVDKAMRMKMGLEGGPAEIVKEADELWEGIEPLLKGSRGDWILFWRQLTYVAAEYKNTSTDYKGMLKTLLGDKQTYPFYEKLSKEDEASLLAWIENWHKAFSKCYSDDSSSAPEEIMRLANPKYVLREYMLADAYLKADSGKTPGSPLPVTSDFSGVHELYRLIKEPYSEGTLDQSKKFYRRAPDKSLTAGGTAFMS